MNKFLKIASVAGVIGLGSLAITIPVQAHSDGHRDGHKSYKHHDNKHHGHNRHHEYKHGYKNHGWRYGNLNDYWPRKHRHRDKHAYKYGFKHGHKHGKKPYYNQYSDYGHRDCHRVHKYKRDYYGDKVRVVGTKCYDKHGYGYIVPGSRRSQHVY